MEPPPPPQYSHSSSTSFPILAISILGILATAILLLSYYLFVINCCLSWRLRRSPSLLLRPRLPDPAPPRPAAPGLADAAIRSIPTLRHGARAGPSPVECAVCLAEFRQQELLRVLPGCAHSFHIDCIDTWLQSTPNCPLCRFDISRLPFPFPAAAVVEVAADGATPTRSATSSKKKMKMKKPPRNFWQAASMGDECIDIGRDESFAVAQPMRRSFSMDSSHDRALFRSVQEALQRNGELVREGGNACGRIRRSLFSFGRSSRSAAAVLPVQSEEPV